MNNLNTVLVEGLLTRDPERMGPEGSSMCRMGLANNRYYFSEKINDWVPDTSFFTIQVYGTAAETCMRRLKKGRGIRVVGRLKQYVNPYTRYEKVFIQAEHIEFQPKKVSEKQEIPEFNKLPGVPMASTDTRELDKEEATAEINAGIPETVEEQIPEETKEMMEESTPDVEEEHEEEVSEDAF